MRSSSHCSCAASIVPSAPPASQTVSSVMHRVLRETEVALKQIVGGEAVGLPEDVARPVRPLHSVIAWGSGVGTDIASVEQRQEIRQLVALGVVDRIAGHCRELHGAACQRTL